MGGHIPGTVLYFRHKTINMAKQIVMINQPPNPKVSEKQQSTESQQSFRMKKRPSLAGIVGTEICGTRSPGASPDTDGNTDVSLGESKAVLLLISKHRHKDGSRQRKHIQ